MFEDVHLLVSEITGTPRIVQINPEKTNFSDKYRDLSREEWENALMGYTTHLPESHLHFALNKESETGKDKNWQFFLLANCKSKEEMIETLEAVIEHVKKEKFNAD